MCKDGTNRGRGGGKAITAVTSMGEWKGWKEKTTMIYR